MVGMYITSVRRARYWGWEWRVEEIDLVKAASVPAMTSTLRDNGIAITRANAIRRIRRSVRNLELEKRRANEWRTVEHERPRR